jgi:hypothetical protein
MAQIRRTKSQKIEHDIYIDFEKRKSQPITIQPIERD